MNNKYLQVNKEIAHKKITIYTETVGLENVGKVVCKTKCKWEIQTQTWRRRGGSTTDINTLLHRKI